MRASWLIISADNFVESRPESQSRGISSLDKLSSASKKWDAAIEEALARWTALQMEHFARVNSLLEEKRL